MKRLQRHKLELAVIALALLLSACTTSERTSETALQQVFVPDLKEVFAAGYTNIIEKYLYSTTVEDLAMEGLRGFGTIDPAITVRRGSGFVIFAADGINLARMPAPGADDVLGWAALTAEFAKQTHRQSSNIQSTDSEHIYEAVFDGALSGLDIFSRYFGAAEAKKNRAKRDGFGGIGIRFKFESGAATVIDVMPETPAQHAGLMRNDIITHIDRVELKSLDTDEVISLMRGSTHTKVQLTVLRPDENITRQFEIERTYIVATTVTAKLENDILFIKVSNFNQGTSDSFAAELKKAKQGNKLLRGLVIDLRGNPGGLLKQSVKFANLLLTQGHIITTSGRHPDSLNHYEAGGRDLTNGAPVIVLVDGRSASAAEIVAAALQDQNRAVVIGTTSFGKGTVQTVIRLPNDGEITLTWSRLVTPSGYTLHGLGVRPAICTSRHKGDIRSLIARTIADRQEIKTTLNSWRTPGMQKEARRQKLRETCPSQRRRQNVEARAANYILNNAALYGRILDLSATDNQAHN